MTGNISIVELLMQNEKLDYNLKNEGGRALIEEALVAGRMDIGELLAPKSHLDDDKIYSTIPEAQFMPP